MKANESKNINNLNNLSNNQNGNFVNIDALIQSVKVEDQKNLRVSKSFLWIYIVLVVFYTGLILVNPDPDIKLNDRFSGACFVLSMIIFAWVFKGALTEYKNIDYTLPLIDLLKKAANRYRLKTIYFVKLTVPILLMDAGLTLSFYEDLLPMEPLNRVLLIQAFYIPIMTISGIIGYYIWRNKQKPLRDNALKLIEELEGE
jgi:hypothetical protein